MAIMDPGPARVVRPRRPAGRPAAGRSRGPDPSRGTGPPSSSCWRVCSPLGAASAPLRHAGHPPVAQPHDPYTVPLALASPGGRRRRDRRSGPGTTPPSRTRWPSRRIRRRPAGATGRAVPAVARSCRARRWRPVPVSRRIPAGDRPPAHGRLGAAVRRGVGARPASRVPRAQVVRRRAAARRGAVAPGCSRSPRRCCWRYGAWAWPSPRPWSATPSTGLELALFVCGVVLAARLDGTGWLTRPRAGVAW